MKLDKTGRAARVSELARRARREGVRASAARLALRAHDRLKTDGLGFLLPEDVADSGALDLPPGRTLRPGEKATVGWICSPPHRGLGRPHDALPDGRGPRAPRSPLRAVPLRRAPWRLRAAGGRRTPGLAGAARRRSATRPPGISGVDACVASAWESAHVLARRGVGPMHRFYFIQDFEPFFYPRGSHYALADRQLSLRVPDDLAGRIGGRAAAHRGGGGIGRWCRSAATPMSTGCSNRPGQRSGVVFFVRPNVPRRGFVLGLARARRLPRAPPRAGDPPLRRPPAAAAVPGHVSTAG